MILELFGTFLAVYTAWSLIAMEINYRRASSMGIPLIRLPIDPLNILFQVFESYVWFVLDRLPWVPRPAFARYARRGWMYYDKCYSHLRYGPIYAKVTPKDIYVQIADPEAIYEVFSHRHNFIRPTKTYGELLKLGLAAGS
jgi:hypothetical protein